MDTVANPREVAADAQKAIAVLATTGMLAKDEEEAHLLTLWREVQEQSDKQYCLGVLTGLTAKT